MARRPPLDPKTPTEEKDYGVDWEDQLNGATIASSSWTVPSGISSLGDSIDGSSTVIRLSGGTAGTNYTLTNEIDTSAGEHLQSAIEVRVRTAAVIAGI